MDSNLNQNLKREKLKVKSEKVESCIINKSTHQFLMPQILCLKSLV
jgi:hypothetical protein